jgi:hypothetical protein
MLDDLDKELERRGHRFVRYADDIMVYVRSERAGQRVIASITQFVESRLKLRVNRDKSAVAPATKRPFLGFGFFVRQGKVRLHIDPKGPEAGQGASAATHGPQSGRLDRGADPDDEPWHRVLGAQVSGRGSRTLASGIESSTVA